MNKEQSKAEKKATLLAKDLDKLQLKEKQVGQAIIVMEAKFTEYMAVAKKVT